MVQRQEFARLIAKGVSNSEACRVVGVNRRTGTRSYSEPKTETVFDNSHYHEVTGVLRQRPRPELPGQAGDPGGAGKLDCDGDGIGCQ